MPAAAPAGALPRRPQFGFHKKFPENHLFECPAWRPSGTLSLQQPDHWARLWGLAAPIRSAGMRARTDMFKYSSDFHHSSVNPSGSCAFLPSRCFVFQPGFDGKIVQQTLIGIFAGLRVIISDAMMIAIETRIRINRILIENYPADHASWPPDHPPPHRIPFPVGGIFGRRLL